MIRSERKGRRLRVCIDARIKEIAGGADMVAVGLASALSRLADGEEEYKFLVTERGSRWLQPYMNGRCSELPSASPPQPWWRKAVGRIPGARRASRMLRRPVTEDSEPRPSESDGNIERSAVEVMHFTQTGAFLTEVPSIYLPYDLQHVHYPEFFNDSENRWRDVCYRAYCNQASAVVALTRWGKEDLVRSFGLPADKVYVIPLAPVLAAYPQPTEAEVDHAKHKLGLPETFLFYPAQTWIHKNHIGLLRVLALLRDQYDVRVPLVCSGHRNEFFPRIENEIVRLNLAGQVQFLGFVSPLEVQSLYRLCRCMIFPSKFEGWGMPLAEAGMAGAPVVCSRVRPICDVVERGALLFDPDNPEDMADKLLRVWTDGELRAELAARGRERAALFTWEKTAHVYRALYRKVGGCDLTERDRELLAKEPLV